MTSTNRMALLSRQPLFASLSAETLGPLATASRFVALDAQQVLFSHGDPSDAVYVVAEGAVAVGLVVESGQEVHFADLGPGAVFGEAAVIDGGPRTAGISAIEPARLLRIPGEAFLAAVRAEPDFALALLRDVVGKLRAADTQIEDRSVLRLDHRLSKFLAASAVDGDVALTQAQIADRLGASREAVNRRLRDLADQGLVALRRGHVAILRPEAWPDGHE